MKRILTIAMCLLCALSMQARGKEVRLDPYFQNHMVFQQEEPIIVWGQAEPKTEVEACFDGETVRTVSGWGGYWQVAFSPRKASFEPKTLTVGEETLTDILVGEVWICAGQSNMVWRIGSSDEVTRTFPDQDDALWKGFRVMNYDAPRHSGEAYGKKELLRCNVKDFFVSTWYQADPEVLQGCSAVATHFGMELSRELKVPVGVIIYAIGGSSIANWIPERALRQHPISAPWFSQNLLTNKAIDPGHRSRIREMMASVHEEGKDWIIGDMPYRHLCEPGFLYEAGPYRIRKAAVKGVLWYQGEADCKKTVDMENYLSFYPLMVNCWRQDFEDSDLPFINIQLPSFNQKTWPQMRAVQGEVVRNTTDTYFSTNIDQGAPKQIHYLRKNVVGQRAADLAVDEIYGKKDFSFPIARTYGIKGDKMCVMMSDVKEQLHFSQENVPSVELVYADGTETAEISLAEPGKIRFSIDPERKLQKVRYAWKPYLIDQSLLMSQDNIPVAPFEFDLLKTAPFTEIHDADLDKEDLVSYHHIALHMGSGDAGQEARQEKSLKELQANHFPVDILSDEEMEAGIDGSYKAVIVDETAISDPRFARSLEVYKAIGRNLSTYPSAADLKAEGLVKSSPAKEEMKNFPFLIKGLESWVVTSFYKERGTGAYVILLRNDGQPSKGKAAMEMNLSHFNHIPTVKDASTGKVLKGELEDNVMIYKLPVGKGTTTIEIQ